MKKLVILIALILLLDLTEQYSKDVFGKKVQQKKQKLGRGLRLTKKKGRKERLSDFMIEHQKKQQLQQEILNEQLNKKLKQLENMRFVEKKKKVQKKKKQFESHGLNIMTQDQRRVLRKHQMKEEPQSVKYMETKIGGNGQSTVHIQLPTRNIDELLKLMDYDKEIRCSYKEGFVANIVKVNCGDVWATPAYIVLTPQSFKLCEKADKNSCFLEVRLCEVSHIHTPKDWSSGPCFQVMGKEKDENGENKVLAQMCASDYAASVGWQHAILSYHRCKEGSYIH